MNSSDLSEKDKSVLFWASFLALMAAGVGFVFRVLVLGDWGKEFNLTGQEMGALFGASLWPIAITMILFSLVVDFIGYKVSMYFAFALQAASAVLTATAGSVDQLMVAAICAGLGHGIVEAVINPVCSSIYKNDKTKMLNILHASWPAGIVAGAVVIIPLKEVSWSIHSLWMLVPVLAYGVMFIKAKFPVDERVKAKVPYSEMLKEVGFLSTFLAFALLTYEITKQMGLEMVDTQRLAVSAAVGAVVGAAVGIYTKSFGKLLYFFLCVLMIPIATTELGTDAWIKELMTPSMGEYAGWAIALSALIMMVLRFQAGILTSRFSPPVILAISSFFSAVGLICISFVPEGQLAVVLLAFTLYAVGQTFYWPTILGFAAEQYPKGGAMTLNTVSAIGLLSVGIIGAQVLGVFNDKATIGEVQNVSQVVYEDSKKEASFFGVKYTSLDRGKAQAAIIANHGEEAHSDAINKANRKSLRLTAYFFPALMMLAFIAIALVFAAKGGYKPVVLEEKE